MEGQTLGFHAGWPPGGAGHIPAGQSSPPQPRASHGSAPRQKDQTSWRAVVRVLRSPLHLAGDVVATVFPAECRHCHGPLEGLSRIAVCAACVAHLRRNDFFGCTKCGEAIDLDLDLEDLRFTGMLAEGFRCRECRLAPPPFTRAVSYGLYDDQLRTLIHLLKYEGARPIAKLLGGQLAQAILTFQSETAADLLVVAVPLHPTRERQRGYNQSILLADAAMRFLASSHPHWRLTAAHASLRRIKATESQYVLSAQGRRRNLRGAFEVAADSNVQGREILLIDDILTSGATARECSRVLLAEGATKVWVATLARAQRRLLQRQHEDPEELVAAWDLNPSAPRNA